MPKKTSRVVTRMFGRAKEMHQQGDFKGARATYQSILNLEPGHPDALHFLGIITHRLQDIQEAERLIRLAIQQQPGNVSAINNLGNVLLDKEDAEAAEACYRRAIELDPDNGSTFNNLCIALRHQGRLQESIECGHTAIKLSPHYAMAWYNLGNTYRATGELEQAAEYYEHATDLDSRFSPGFDAHCRTVYELERRRFFGRRTWSKTIHAYSRWLKQQPGHPLASFMYRSLKEKKTLPRAPDSVVRNMFDHYAPSFESKLARLEYRVPELLGAVLDQRLEAPAANLEVLDGGCGTGLCGPFLKPFANKLTGVDLSTEMIGQATNTELYDELVVAELTGFLKDQNETFDLIACGDIFCYFGDLKDVLEASARAMRPSGLLVFSVEKLPGRKTRPGYAMHTQGRYMHSKPYIEGLLIANGFSGLEFNEEGLRLEMGRDVIGYMVSARRGSI